MLSGLVSFIEYMMLLWYFSLLSKLEQGLYLNPTNKSYIFLANLADETVKTKLFLRYPSLNAKPSKHPSRNSFGYALALFLSPTVYVFFFSS